jgi:capsid protein
MQINGPLNTWVVPPGSKVTMTDTKFNGADLSDYLIIVYKVMCAVLQMPVDVVLCQMGNASLSSARAGLDQFDRTCQTEQELHIGAVSQPMDQSAVADAIAPTAVVARADAPTFTTIDELRWSGPRGNLAEVAARIDAPRLIERAAKLAQTRN